MNVQCIDKKFYRSPIWYATFGKQRWIVNFNHEEELEFSLEVDRKTSPRIGSLAREILRDWPVRLQIGVFDTMGAFPSDWEVTKRWKYLLLPSNLLPIPTEHKGIMDSVALDALKYCWEVAFPILDVWEYFQKSPYRLCGNLCDYLLGGFLSPFAEKKRVRNVLKKQFPEIVKLTILEATIKYGERVKVLRNGPANRQREDQRLAKAQGQGEEGGEAQR